MRLTVSTSGGCQDCEDDSFVMFDSRRVEATGLMRFESDCNFSRMYLDCGLDRQLVTLMEKAGKN